MSNERIARLEAKMENVEATLHDMRDDVKVTRQHTAEIREGLQKQKGFIAGGVAVIVAVWTVVAAGITIFWQKILGVFWP
jgi:type IV secretory pathway VirB2 component (pilin)